MKRIPRHITVAFSAALVAYFFTPHIARYAYSLSFFTERASAEGVGILASFCAGSVWFVFSLFLRNPKVQQWLILGFFSPVIAVPLYYFVGSLLVHYESHFYGGESPLKTGLVIAFMLSWIFTPMGLLTSFVSAYVAKYTELILQPKPQQRS